MVDLRHYFVLQFIYYIMKPFNIWFGWGGSILCLFLVVVNIDYSEWPHTLLTITSCKIFVSKTMPCYKKYLFPTQKQYISDYHKLLMTSS